MVFADKTANMYDMSKKEYAKRTKKRQHPLKRKSTKKQNTLLKN